MDREKLKAPKSHRKRTLALPAVSLKSMGETAGSTGPRIPRALLGTLLLVAGANVRGGDDAAFARGLHDAGSILSLEHFAAKAREIHPGTLVDARLHYEDEHQAYVYEIQILDGAGEVWEVEFDAETGALIERERRHP